MVFVLLFDGFQIVFETFYSISVLVQRCLLGKADLWAFSHVLFSLFFFPFSLFYGKAVEINCVSVDLNIVLEHPELFVPHVSFTRASGIISLGWLTKCGRNSNMSTILGFTVMMINIKLCDFKTLGFHV